MITIEGYQISTQLYEGVHSIIYRGRRKTDDRPVILKLLKGDPPTPEAITQFRQEYDRLRTVDVDGVSRVYALESCNTSFVMVMEDIGGESLVSLLSHRRLELPECLRLAIRVTEILEKIHQRQIIHKNINPANIIWNPTTDHVNIIDFGISTQLSREQPDIRNPNVLEGTLPYMSPEQTGRMNRAMDSRTDLYSLGVTLYQMVTGHLPFHAEDAMELVHCHLAKMPVPLCELHPPAPLKGGSQESPLEGGRGVSSSSLEGEKESVVLNTLSDIIMKLLAKNAEDRYQSAYGLQADLKWCLDHLQVSSPLPPFELAQHDISERFRIPQKLYGREQERETLLSAFDRIANPQSHIEFLLITGDAGVGKSTLVNEIHKPITEKHGYFITGKFDQFKQTVPYSAIIHAFQGLMRHLLAESDTQLTVWKERLLKAVGPDGQVIIDVIPDVELLIGKQPAVPELPPQQTQHRFNFVFQNFVRTFAAEEHPLVMFLDDMQWADASSLKLLEVCLADPNTTCMLVIGSYREHDVNNAHPLISTLRTIQETGVIVNTLALTPLTLDHVHQLLIDTLHVGKPTPASSLRQAQDIAQEGKALAELVLRKTGGNPFFVRQFLHTLYDHGLLTFDGSRRVWTWNLDDIQQQEITDNVIDLMIRKIQTLPQATRHVLQLAACIGNQFDLETLALVHEHDPAATLDHLWEALQEDLIIQSDVEGPGSHFTFLHDRIRQVAYALLDDADRQRTHLAIGRALLAHTPEADWEERMFDIVNHLNQGRALITTSTENILLAELNLRAGTRAKTSTAYQPAYSYLQQGMHCLDPACWQKEYQLTLTLHEETAEAAYLSGDFDTMEALTAVVFQHARTVLETVKVSEIRIRASIAQDHLVEMIKTGLDILRRLGIRVPQNPGKISLIAALLKVKLLLLGKPIEALVNLPTMHDPRILAVVRIMNSMAAASFMTIPRLAIFLSLTENYLSLRYGHTSTSPYGYSSYGLILCGVTGEIEAGYRFGQLALTLQDQLKEKEFTTRTALIVHAIVRPWKDHLRDVLQPLRETYRIGRETGDVEFAGYAATTYARFAMFTGDHLARLEEETRQFNHILAQLGQDIPLSYNTLFRQAILNLRGNANDPTRLVGESYDEERMIPLYQATKNHAPLSYIYVLKLILCYLFHDYAQAVHQVSLAEPHLESMVGSYYLSLFSFYDSLTRLALWGEMSGSEQRRALKKVTANQKKMKTWAHHAPMNHRHKWQLVEAERARVLENKSEAMEWYDKAIEGARAHKYVNEEALANELAAQFYLAKGSMPIARTYLHAARSCYLAWGAQAKVQHLDDTYPEVLAEPNEHRDVQLTVTDTPASEITPQTLDVSTVVKASQTISGEMVLADVLKKMMHIMIENAGAQKGFLLLEHDGAWCIEAEGGIAHEEVEMLHAIPLESAALSLAATIVQYVVRTHQTVTMNDVAHKGDFTGDPYVSSRQPQSILCLPLLHQAKLIGILYLENDLATGAFSPDHVDVLNLLSSQMAISLENARLYADVAQREQKYRTLFEESKDAIFLTTPGGAFVDANQAFLDLFGASRAEIMATQVSDLYVHPADHRRFLEIMGQEGTVRDFEATLQKTDGTPMECLLTATVRRAQEGEILSYQGIIRDITERKQAEELLKNFSQTLQQEVEQRTQELEMAREQALDAKEAAEAANRAKSEFLANMSHELRTPLNAILGYAQILKRDRSLTDKQQGAIETIHHSGDHLLLMINDLLDLSRIEARKMELEPTTFHFPGFLKSIVEIIRIRAQQKGITFNDDIASDLPIGVHADEKRVRQILLNLLNNAIKFTEQGRVTLRVKSEKLKMKSEEAEATLRQAQDIAFHASFFMLHFEIEDTGSGIPSEHLQEIFLPFHQISDLHSRREGTGLGLAISQHLARMMGSELQVKSVVGQGTTFWFDLELPEVHEEVIASTAHLSRQIIGYTGEKRTILVVDDKEKNRTVLRDILLPLGFDLLEAVDGRDALNTAQASHPDLILMDLVMPVMDGFEATRRIRKIPELQDLIVIGISASAFESTKQESFAAGCHDFLVKPVHFEELLESVGRHLDLEWIYAETIEPIPEEPPAAEVGPLVIPPQEILMELLEAAQGGYITDIEETLATMKASDPALIPFAAKIEHLAATFQFGQIIELIESHMEG